MAFVYVMEPVDNEEGIIKIGASADPERRLEELEYIFKFSLRLCHAVDTGCVAMRELENRAHQQLKNMGRHNAYEWFFATPSEGLWAIYRGLRAHEWRCADGWIDRRLVGQQPILWSGRQRLFLSTRNDCFA
jgi:hypothetical protein